MDVHVSSDKQLMGDGQDDVCLAMFAISEE
jgi:hypothetical protein